MDERPKNGWQAWLAGALFLGVLAAALLIGRPASKRSVPPPAAPPAIVPTKALPTAVPPLERVGLIRLAQRAASAYARGAAAPEAHRDLVGRRFELRLPFGCGGPASKDAEVSSGWRYDREKGSLRAFAGPQDWSDTQWLRSVIGDGAVERAEGFPVDRPWILEPSCPTVAKTAPPEPEPGKGEPETETPVAAEETMTADPADTAPELALVELFSADAPRSASRGDRSYVAVVKRPPESVDASLWFMLVLSGRIATFPGSDPVLCWGNPAAARPHCLIAVQIDRAAIVDRDGTELAQWVQ